MKILLLKIVNNSFGINALKKGITILSGLIFLILMTRFLGPELRGEYAYILNTVNILATIFNLGISLVLPNYLKQKSKLNTNVFLSISIYQFLIYLFISLVVFFFSPSLELFAILFLSALTILTMQISNISLVSNIKIHSFSIIVSCIVNIILILIVYFSLETNLYYIILIYAIKEFVIVTVNLIFFKIKIIKPERDWIKILKAGFVPMLATGLIAFNYKIDVIMLEWLDINFLLIGLFATGVSLAEYSWLVPDIFKEVMLNKNTKRDEIELLNFSLRFAFTSVIFFAIFFILFGKLILLILFGDQFVDSYIYTVLMFLAVPFMVFVKIIGTLFITNGKWNLYFRILLFTVLINVFSNYFLIKEFGTIGAAIASIISYSFCGIYCLKWYSSTYSVSFYKLFLISSSDVKNLRLFLINK